MPPVDLERAREEDIDLVGDREDCWEEVERILQVGLERAIVRRRRLPRVAPRNEVKQDDTKRPDIVKERGVASRGREDTALAL